MAGVEWSGIEAFVRKLDRTVVKVDVGVRVAAAAASHDLEARAKKAFTEAHKSGTPTPSLPGSPPAVVTGTLRRSYTVDGPVRLGFGVYEAAIGPTVVYARVQELGGQAGRNLAATLPARPSFVPAYDGWLRDRVLRREVLSAVNGAIR
jgi:phage gpG-like protein